MKDQFRFNLDRFELDIDIQPPTQEQLLIAVAWLSGIIAALLFIILCARLIERAGG
jgi:hypothetical protein